LARAAREGAGNARAVLTADDATYAEAKADEQEAHDRLKLRSMASASPMTLSLDFEGLLGGLKQSSTGRRREPGRARCGGRREARSCCHGNAPRNRRMQMSNMDQVLGDGVQRSGSAMQAEIPTLATVREICQPLQILEPALEKRQAWSIALIRWRRTRPRSDEVYCHRSEMAIRARLTHGPRSGAARRDRVRTRPQIGASRGRQRIISKTRETGNGRLAETLAIHEERKKQDDIVSRHASLAEVAESS